MAMSSRQNGSDAKATARLRGDLKREKALAAEMQHKLRAAEEQVINTLKGEVFAHVGLRSIASVSCRFDEAQLCLTAVLVPRQIAGSRAAEDGAASRGQALERQLAECRAQLAAHRNSLQYMEQVCSKICMTNR